jgi:RimJ/RimL family protein N-acetyltransferase
MNTRRLSMEPLAPPHAPLLFTGLADPRLYTYVPEEAPTSLDALARRFEHLAAGCPDHGEVWRNWVMFEGAAPVGMLQASVYADRHAVIAYMLLYPFWGQGLAAEGVSWMLAELAAHDRAIRAEAYIDTHNERSLRLVRRLGFQHRATILDADSFKGRRSNEHVYDRPLRAPDRLASPRL